MSAGVNEIIVVLHQHEIPTLVELIWPQLSSIDPQLPNLLHHGHSGHRLNLTILEYLLLQKKARTYLFVTVGSRIKPEGVIEGYRYEGCVILG